MIREHRAAIARGVIHGLALSTLVLIAKWPGSGGGGGGGGSKPVTPYHPPQEPTECVGILFDVEGGTHFCGTDGPHARCTCGACEETWANPTWQPA